MSIINWPDPDPACPICLGNPYWGKTLSSWERCHCVRDRSDFPPRQVNADGSVEFTCQGCGQDVFCAVDDGFEFPACMECRWFGERPNIKRPEYRR